MPSLRDLRGDVTQADFASRLGLSQAMYQKLESGAYPSHPTAETVRRMAEGAGLTEEAMSEAIVASSTPGAKGAAPRSTERRTRTPRPVAMPAGAAPVAAGTDGELDERLRELVDALAERIAVRITPIVEERVVNRLVRVLGR